MLIVDDDEDLRRIAEICLQVVGELQVIVASSGAEGIRQARDQQPDLILLDVMMPEMSGIEMFKRLRVDKTTASIPVIFITTRTQEHAVDTYLDLGAIGVLAKPYDPMELATEVRELFDAKKPDQAS